MHRLSTDAPVTASSPAPRDDTGVRVVIELAGALRAFCDLDDELATECAAALLPTVERLAAERAAEELRAIGREALAETPGAQRVHVPVDVLFDRAEDLHPEPIRFAPPTRASSLRGRAIPPRATGLATPTAHTTEGEH